MAVRELLGDLWGDALPATGDPWLRLVGDGLAADDEAGRQEGLVVRSDALHLVVLERLVKGDLAPRRPGRCCPTVCGSDSNVQGNRRREPFPPCAEPCTTGGVAGSVPLACCRWTGSSACS